LNDLAGSADVVAGEPLILYPRIFRQTRAWMEPNKRGPSGARLIRRGHLRAFYGYLTRSSWGRGVDLRNRLKGCVSRLD